MYSIDVHALSGIAVMTLLMPLLEQPTAIVSSTFYRFKRAIVSLAQNPESNRHVN